VYVYIYIYIYIYVYIYIYIYICRIIVIYYCCYYDCYYYKIMVIYICHMPWFERQFHQVPAIWWWISYLRWHRWAVGFKGEASMYLVWQVTPWASEVTRKSQISQRLSRDCREYSAMLLVFITPSKSTWLQKGTVILSHSHYWLPTNSDEDSMVREVWHPKDPWRIPYVEEGLYEGIPDSCHLRCCMDLGHVSEVGSNRSIHLQSACPSLFVTVRW